MIVKMQKVAVLSLSSAETELLAELRRLGVLHITPKEKPERHTAEAISEQQKTVQGVTNILLGLPKTKGSCDLSAEEAVEKVLALNAEISSNNDAVQKLQNQLNQLSVWGDFDPKAFARLKESGVIVKLFQCPEKNLPEAPLGAILQVIAKAQGQIFFAVASQEDFTLDCQEISLPEKATVELKAEVEERSAASAKAKAELNTLTAALPALEKYLEKIEGELRYARAFDSLSQEGKIAYLEGYVPNSSLEALKEKANQEGWGLWYEDAKRDDPLVPTLLKVPGWLKPVGVFFNFIDAMPSYKECDISLPVMIFFTLFFSIIVGDAGYGLLYLLAGIILKIKVKSKGAQQAINFLIILSCGTVAWGLLTGSVFGIKKDLLPWFLAGLPCLRGEQSMKCIQWLCFTIALCHLAGARLWRAIIAGSVREALGNLGWMFFISFNFLLIISMIVGDPFPFTAHPGFEAFPSWCYCGGGIGAILILLFSVKWKEIGDVLYTPFNFINSFVDVLSYIRLFAVGLSGAYIAQCFNNMGGMIYAGQTGWKLVILAICGGLVIIIGHILNIVLGMMSVLVHGLRLNTLEFSNHMQIGWEGKAYSPFRETNEQ